DDRHFPLRQFRLRGAGDRQPVRRRRPAVAAHRASQRQPSARPDGRRTPARAVSHYERIPISFPSPLGDPRMFRLSRLFGSAATGCARRLRRRVRLQVEELETRLAPAVLVNPTTVKYQDVDGDNVTVKLSLPLLTDEDTANAVLQFKTGSVDGSNTARQ